jgi:putative PIG3 family NAD(P)H quinone oxidoreductase
MRAVIITRPGGPEVMELTSLPAPVPGPGEVAIRVRAFGINRADLLQRLGRYPAPPGAPENIPGLEYAGEVEAAGPGVSGLSPGERVMGIVAGGAYAELLVTPADHALAVPPGLSMEEAAAIPEAFITAHDALERAGVSAGDWVLVHAVGSGVGTAAVQLIHSRGARVIGTSRTTSKLDRAREMGVDVCLDSSGGEFAAAVRDATGGGANAAIDLIGGPRFAETLDAMALKGRVVLVGLTAGAQAEVNLGVILRRRLRIEGTVLRSRSREEKSAVIASFRRDVLPLFSAGDLHVVVDRVLPFEDVREAHACMESNTTFGKVVVTVDHAAGR